MTRLTRESYNIEVANTMRVGFQRVEGYTFSVDVNGMPWGIGVRKLVGMWYLDDLATGRGLNSGRIFRRRCDAVLFAESDFMRERLANLDPHKTLARAKMFERVRNGEHFSMAEYDVLIEELTLRLREEMPIAEPEPEPDPAEAVAAETALSTLARWREEFAGWENVLVMQRNEHCLIWVVGDTKPRKDALKELGFRFGESRDYGKGWWIRPTVDETVAD